MNRTGCPDGTAVTLFEDVLPATAHPRSSNPGCASGFSGAYFHVPSAGRATGRGGASGARAARLPEGVADAGTGRQFQVRMLARCGAHTSSGAATVVSPVRSSTGPRTAAVRTSTGP